MTFEDAILTDYQITDGVETITLLCPRVAGTITGVVHYADPQAFTLKEIAASEGLYQAGDLGFRLGSLELASLSITPQRGDSIIRPDGTVYKIIAEPTLDNFEISWLCPARKTR